ncbi:MAG: DNA polymerase III subunit delta [Chitinophagia bacterium]|nr:DNA polymerase III subunit delta [Chitinophagia bacterium]
MPTSKIIANWKKQVFDAIYWLEGEEAFYIDQVVEYAEKHLLPESEQAFNLTLFYGKDAQWADVINACKRYPVFAERQVVILKEAQHMGQIEKLLSYVENPLSSTILIVAHKDKNVDGRSALAKALKTKAVVVSTKKMYDSKLPEWVSGWVSDHQFQIAPKAVQMIVDHIGNDLSRIQNELEKLTVNLGARKKITEDDVEKYIGISKEYNAFEFQDAIAQKNFSKAIKMIQYFESNNKAAPIQLILPTLYAFFSKLYAIYGLGTQDEKTIMSQVGIPFFGIKNYMVAARNYSYSKVQHILILIQAYNLRVIGIHDADNTDADLLKELVVKIMDSAIMDTASVN